MRGSVPDCFPTTGLPESVSAAEADRSHPRKYLTLRSISLTRPDAHRTGPKRLARYVMRNTDKPRRSKPHRRKLHRRKLYCSVSVPKRIEASSAAGLSSSAIRRPSPCPTPHERGRSARWRPCFLRRQVSAEPLDRDGRSELRGTLDELQQRDDTDSLPQQIDEKTRARQRYCSSCGPHVKRIDGTTARDVRECMARPTGRHRSCGQTVSDPDGASARTRTCWRQHGFSAGARGPSALPAASRRRGVASAPSRCTRSGIRRNEAREIHARSARSVELYDIASALGAALRRPGAMPSQASNSVLQRWLDAGGAMRSDEPRRWRRDRANFTLRRGPARPNCATLVSEDREPWASLRLFFGARYSDQRVVRPRLSPVSSQSP